MSGFQTRFYQAVSLPENNLLPRFVQSFSTNDWYLPWNCEKGQQQEIMLKSFIMAQDIVSNLMFL